MGGVWNFLRQKRNQQVLSWLGGGLVVAATGAWVVFVYLFPAQKEPEVRANCGGVAVGGNVSGSTITAGTATGADCVAKPK